MEALHLCVNVLSRTGQVIDAAGAFDPPRDQLGIAREQAEDVDVLQEPHIVAVRPDREAPLVMLRHEKQRLEDEIIKIN